MWGIDSLSFYKYERLISYFPVSIDTIVELPKNIKEFNFLFIETYSKNISYCHTIFFVPQLTIGIYSINHCSEPKAFIFFKMIESIKIQITNCSPDMSINHIYGIKLLN